MGNVFWNAIQIQKPFTGGRGNSWILGYKLKITMSYYRHGAGAQGRGNERKEGGAGGEEVKKRAVY